MTEHSYNTKVFRNALRNLGVPGSNQHFHIGWCLRGIHQTNNKMSYRPRAILPHHVNSSFKIITSYTLHPIKGHTLATNTPTS
jgi:hypothetical protein